MGDEASANDSGFSTAERAAMKQRAAELKAVGRVKGATKRAKEFDACIAAIGELTGSDKRIAERLHVIVLDEAPHLDPKTWYGFPSYAKDDKVVVFFQPAAKFDTRYGSIGFNDVAALDDGNCWPTSYAVLDMTEAEEKLFRKLIKQATG